MSTEINSLKHCPHKEVKPKLVAWAIDVNGGHEQGFRTVNCCTACGKVVPTTNEASNLTWITKGE